MNKCGTLGLVAAVCLLFAGNSLSTQATTFEYMRAIPEMVHSPDFEAGTENIMLAQADTGDNATGVLAQVLSLPHEISDSCTLSYYHI